MADQLTFPPVFPASVVPTDIVGVSISSPASGSVAAIVTFGQAFKAGDVPVGSGLALRLSDGEEVPVQLDTSTRYADGSAKFGTITARLPALPAGQGTGVLVLTNPSTAPALDLSGLLARHTVAVTVSPTDGGTAWSVDLASVLAASLRAGTTAVWSNGPLASQARISLDVPPSALGGAASMRLVADLTVRTDGSVSADIWMRNDAAMEAAGGAARYGITVGLDGTQALQADAIVQAQYQDWGRLLDTRSASLPTVQTDPAYLASTGAIAKYDTSIGVADSLLASYGNAVASAGWDTVLGARGITQYMPETGARADIGPTTQAQAAWLLTGDAKAAAYAIGQAEAGGAIPWNLWDAASPSTGGTGTWLRVTDWPALWSDIRGGAPPTGLAQQIPTTTGWTPDVAHQPDLDYVPYLLTGRRAFLDQVESQASWNIAAEWPDARLDAQGILANGNQVRGAAWALRQVDEAAWAAPDGSPEAAYFRTISDNNWAWLASKLPEWTAAEGESYGWIPGDYGVSGALPPWQQDYFATTAAAAARNGNTDARTVLAWEANFLVGRFTHAADGFDPHDGIAYLLDVGTGATAQTTWAGIAAATQAHGDSNDGGWATSQGNYAQLALGSLASLANVLDLQPARDAYAWLIAAGAPFTAAADYAADPTFAIVPTEAGTASGTVPSLPPVTSSPVTSSPVVIPAAGTLVLNVSEDAWQGDAQFSVRVDGQQVGTGWTATASHAAGLSQAVILGSGFAPGSHQVSVTFLNDAWGGTADTDRNLYVDSIALDGVQAANTTAQLLNSGTVGFTVVAGAPAGPSAGPDSALVLNVSEDAWNGNAEFTVSVDGQPSGGTWFATASHALGQTQQVFLPGQFGSGAHDLAVTFTNDAWGGTTATDRNLYVDSVEYGGQHFGSLTAALLSNGTVHIAIPALTT